MTGYRQREKIAVPDDWQKQFGFPSVGGKVVCLICGRTGWPNDIGPAPWQLYCLEGHPEQCELCGARFRKDGLNKHLVSTKGRCADRPVGNHARLLQLMDESDHP